MANRARCRALHAVVVKGLPLLVLDMVVVKGLPLLVSRKECPSLNGQPRFS